jgi:hypothetical protein
MYVLYLIIGIGLFVSLLVVAGFMLFEKVARRGRTSSSDAKIPDRSKVEPHLNPGLLMSKLGGEHAAERSLDTMILRPTWGIKLFGFVIAALLITTMMGSAGALYREDLVIWSLVLSVLIYLGLFLAKYEVRFDSDTITAPGIFFFAKTHPWSEFISIEKVDNVHYKLKFERGTLKIKKFLVGMPTLLTFATDVREMNKRP